MLLTACSSDSEVVQVGEFFYTLATAEPVRISRESAAAIPYATMSLALGSSSQVLLILGSTADGDRDWFAGDQVFVRTRHGRVIRTVGLPYDLGGLRILPADAAPGSPTTGTLPSQYVLDFPDLGVFGATAQCSSKNAGVENVVILGTSVATRHIVEHCGVAAMKWNFDNEYWLDVMTGYVWRSSQHIHPKSAPLILEALRPEANPA